MKKIPSEVHNLLRQQFKKGDSINYLKNLCKTIILEDMEEFTSYAMMSAYQAKRAKALDYMLGLEGRDKALLLISIHLGIMLSSEENFEKNLTMLSVICKNFDRSVIILNLEELRKNHVHVKNSQILFKKLLYEICERTFKPKDTHITKKINKI